jgi:hypothetical protein
VTGSILRGRPRPAAPLHLLASRELTGAMRQLRVATGDDFTSAVVLLNQAIMSLYPDAAPADVDRAGRAVPHLVTKRFVEALEKGHHSRLDLYRLPSWIDVSRVRDKTQLYSSRVPDWLVRAYDLAFCANGYLVDMFAWSAALLPDQLRDVPRRLRDLPAHVPPGTEYAFLAEHFLDADDELRALLAAQAEMVAVRRDGPRDDAPWSPSPGDESSSHDEIVEGQLVAPGHWFVAIWCLRNTGSVPWRDRVLYRIGAYPGGVHTPPILVIPDTDPGEVAIIRCPMRAPTTAGTYRACLKAGWPDGTYCFPSTLLGLFATLVVAPADLADPAAEWADHAG